MPPRSAAPATPPSGAGSPQTKSAAGDHDPRPERQTGTRTSRLEPRTDQSLRSPRHDCAGMAQGAIATMQGIGASLSGLVAGVIVDNFGYSTGFLSLETVALFAVIVFVSAMPEAAE